MKWEDVQARSLAVLGGTTCFCFDCYMNFHLVEMPCAKHCLTDEERALRLQLYNEKIEECIQSYPPPIFIKKRTPGA
jgi:hypothetical protein